MDQPGRHRRRRTLNGWVQPIRAQSTRCTHSTRSKAQTGIAEHPAHGDEVDAFQLLRHTEAGPAGRCRAITEATPAAWMSPIDKGPRSVSHSESIYRRCTPLATWASSSTSIGVPSRPCTRHCTQSACHRGRCTRLASPTTPSVSGVFTEVEGPNATKTRTSKDRPRGGRGRAAQRGGCRAPPIRATFFATDTPRGWMWASSARW